MSLRWNIGVFLGYVNGSNEHYIGSSDGHVLKTRSIVRIVEGERWSKDAVLKIRGIPGHHQPLSVEEAADKVEQSEDPHANLDDVERRDLEGEAMVDDKANSELSDEVVKTLDRQTRITQRDLKLYGYTGNCHRGAGVWPDFNCCTDADQGIWWAFGGCH